MSNRPTVSIGSTEDLRNAIEAGYQPDQLVVSTPDLKRVRGEGYAAGLAASEEQWKAERIQLVSEAAAGLHPDVRRRIEAAERDRIAGIRAVAQTGFERIAERAIADGMTPEKFAHVQSLELRDRGISFDAIRRDSPPAADHAPPGDDNPASSRREGHGGVFARRKAQAISASK